MNVYDFDKTIFYYDSTVKFYFYMLSKKPSLIRYFPKQACGFIKYFLKQIDVTQMKSYFYCYLKGIDDIDKELELFWDKNIVHVNRFYLENHKPDDVVITGSAYFMVEPCMKRLNIKYLLASSVDKKTGEVLSKNCSKQQKIVEFEKAGFKVSDIEQFYSDSHRDDCLASLAKEPYYVTNGKIRPWGKIND